jgi:hypothetical protein
MENLLSVLGECAGKPDAAIETTKEDHPNRHAEKKISLFYQGDAV